MLTQCQQNAIDALQDLYFSSSQKVLVIEGPAGTGKSTLINHFVNQVMPSITIKDELTNQPSKKLLFAATTNKAAEALSKAAGVKAKTIHSHLQIVLSGGKLRYRTDPLKLHNVMLFVDEFSYLDTELLDYILKVTKPNTTKIVFIGDPNQLPPVKQSKLALAGRNFPTVTLKEVVRQESPALRDLANSFRDYVSKGTPPEIVPNGVDILYYGDSAEDEDEYINALKRAQKYTINSKFISFTNIRAQEINRFLYDEIKGGTLPKVGDYMTVNTYYSCPRTNMSFKTDTSVYVNSIVSGLRNYNILRQNGSVLTVPYMQLGIGRVILNYIPDYDIFVDLVKSAHKHMPQENLDFIDQVCDLRHEYACTVHKSQGSSYEEVFIDLTDFRSIQKSDTLARLLYVAVSRVRKKLHIIGDL